MKDTGYPLRKAFYELLDGNLLYNSIDVPVYDDVLMESADLYVILSSQTKSPSDNFCTFVSNCTITLDIVHKSQFTFTKDAVDSIHNQIGQLLSTGPGRNSLPFQSGFQFSTLQEDSFSYLPTLQSGVDGYITRKLITYRIRIVEQ